MKRNIIFEGCHQQKFSQNFSFYNWFGMVHLYCTLLRLILSEIHTKYYVK